MALSKNDLSSIKGIVTEAVEDSKLHTAAGFAEVHQKFDDVDKKFADVDNKFAKVFREVKEVKTQLKDIDATVGRIELQQRAEVERVDGHDQAIVRIKRKLSLA